MGCLCVFVEEERNESSKGLTKAGCDVVVIFIAVVVMIAVVGIVVGNVPVVVVAVDNVSLLLGTP